MGGDEFLSFAHSNPALFASGQQRAAHVDWPDQNCHLASTYRVNTHCVWKLRRSGAQNSSSDVFLNETKKGPKPSFYDRMDVAQMRPRAIRIVPLNT